MNPDNFFNQLNEEEQAQKLEQDKADQIGAVNQSGDKVVEALKGHTNELTGSIHDLLMATLVSKDPKIAETAKNLAGLLGEIKNATKDIKGANFKPLADSLSQLQETLTTVPQQIEAAHQATDPNPLLQEIATTLGKKNFNPSVNVKAPSVDLSPLTKILTDIKKAVSTDKEAADNSKLEDLTQSVASAVNDVKDAITSLRFPVANYVLPWSQNGKDVQVVLDGSGNVPISGSITPSGTQDVNVARVGNTVFSLGQTTMSASLPVTIASNQSALALPTGASTSDNQTNGTQLTRITNGTQTADTVAGDTGQNFLAVGSSRKEVTFTTTSAQAVASTDVSNYRWVSVQIVTQGTTSTVTFQGSNDNINWVSVSLTISTTTGTSAPVVSTTSASSYSGPLNFRYFRLNVTGISAGTTAGVIEFFSTPAAMIVPGGSTPLTQLALADNADGVVASATANGLKTMSAIRLFDGTNYNRWQQSQNATNSIGTGIPAVGNLAQFDDVSPTAITENSFGNLRMSANRNLYGTIRDAAGNERGVNVTAGNALTVDASATTQPVSATSLPLPTLAATSTKQSDGSQKSQIVDGSGNVVTVTGNKLDVNATISGTSGGTSSVDNAAFTAGSGTSTPVAGFYHSAIDTVTDGRVATVGMTNKRGLFVNLQTAAGAETGVAATPLQVSLANTGANSSKLLVTPDSVALPANQSVNVSQINAVTPLMGNGVTGTGSQRVTIASDNTAFSVNATLSAETTKVIGTVRTADGAGNLYTTNSTTYTAKFAQDGNLLGTLGTAFSTAGKVDVKAADGDVFVRQATASNLNATVVGTGTFAVQTTPTAPTTIYNGKKTVTTAGTRVTLAASQAVKSVTIKALTANTGTIYVGDASVASTTGFELLAGDSINMDIANLNTVNLDSSVNGEGVTYVGTN